MSHLSDEVLNEYLDAALSASALAMADAHLAGCGPCADRLEALRGLFATIETLPELTLERDLSAGVVAAVGGRPVLPRPVRVGLLVQGLAAFVLLVMAWPALGEALARAGLSAPAAPAMPTIDQLAGWFALSWSGWAQSLARFSNPALFPVSLSPGLDPPAFWLGLTLASACLLWLVGNGVLLRPGSDSYKRRHS